MNDFETGSNPRSFRRTDDYSQLQSGAHRKPATPIGVPALVAHFGFWQFEGPKAESDKTGESLPPEGSAGDSWNNRCDEYMRAIYCLVRDFGFDTPNTERGAVKGSQHIFLFDSAIEIESPTLRLKAPTEFVGNNTIDEYFNTRNQAIVFSFMWHFISVLVRFEKHQEFLTITCFLDLSVIPTTTHTADGQDITDEALEKDEIFESLERRLRDFAIDLKLYREFLAGMRIIEQNDIRDRFWDHHRTLYTDVWTKFTNCILMSNIPLTIMGGSDPPTVENYAAKLGKVFADFRGLVVGDLHSNTSLRGDSVELQNPRWRRLGVTQEHWLGKRMRDKEARNSAKQFWPFVTSERLVPLRKKEFTVNRMLNGHALYISALGAQPSPYGGPAPDGGDQFPVYYLMYVTTFSQWQIGRLIERINYLGILRIAALHELKSIYDVGTKLRKLQVPRDPSGLQPVQQEINDWDRDFAGGLNYRIERSRYYVRQFVSGIDQLRIKRVEGFQPYDLFVLRRLSSTFDFIDRLGVRLDRFRSRLDTSALLALQTSSNKHLEKADAHARRLLKLQQVGELFLWLALAPYYVTGMIEHIVDRVRENHHELPDNILASVYIVVWSLSILFGIVRYRQLSTELDDNRSQGEKSDRESFWSFWFGCRAEGPSSDRLNRAPAATPAMAAPGNSQSTAVASDQPDRIRSEL